MIEEIKVGQHIHEIFHGFFQPTILHWVVIVIIAVLSASRIIWHVVIIATFRCNFLIIRRRRRRRRQWPVVVVQWTSADYFAGNLRAKVPLVAG